MIKEKLFDEIREANLNYLMLAQHLIRLGIATELADLLEALSPAQLMKIASSTTLLCRLRYDDRLVLDLLVNHARGGAMSRTHAAILGANRPVEALA
jgi:flagellar transcriptional activator FlhD